MNRMVMACVAAIVATTLVPAANAQTTGKLSDAEITKVLHNIYGIRPVFDRCVEQLGDGGSQSQECVRKELAYQDARLNRAYKSLMGKLTPDMQPKLKVAEKVWIQYRDTNCSAEFDGLGRPELDQLSCEMYETAKQAGFLENRLSFQ